MSIPVFQLMKGKFESSQFNNISYNAKNVFWICSEIDKKKKKKRSQFMCVENLKNLVL